MVDLSTLSDRDFSSLVAEEARSLVNPDLAREFRKAENLRRWHDALADITAEVGVKLAERSATVEEAKASLDAFRAQCLKEGEGGRDSYLAAKADYDATVQRPHAVWKSKALRFRLSIDRRLTEAKRRIGHRDEVMTRALTLIARIDDGNAAVIANQAIAEVGSTPGTG